MFEWLKSLFARNPTIEWRETVTAPPVDVTRCQAMGLGFKTRSEAFRSLGPADRWPGKNGNGFLDFPAKGLHLEFEYDQLVALLVTFIELDGPPKHPAFRPFAGSLLAGGVPLQIRGGDKEAKIIAAIGNNFERDDDEDETILRYTFGDVVTEFEIDKPAGLARINVFMEGEVKPL